jgi:hypothetical protein
MQEPGHAMRANGSHIKGVHMKRQTNTRGRRCRRRQEVPQIRPGISRADAIKLRSLTTEQIVLNALTRRCNTLLLQPM